MFNVGEIVLYKYLEQFEIVKIVAVYDKKQGYLEVRPIKDIDYVVNFYTNSNNLYKLNGLLKTLYE